VTLWWIGNAVLLVVTLALVVLLQRLMKPIKEIEKHVDEIIQHGGAVSANLNAVPKLVQTQQLVGVARQGVGAYGAAITNLL
jgi:uncharacterized protein YoxC